MNLQATTYTPKPGGAAAMALAHLQGLEHGAEVMTSRLAEAIGLPPATMTPSLQGLLDAGLVFRRQKERRYPKAPFFWSLVDHSKTDGTFVSRASDEGAKPPGPPAPKAAPMFMRAAINGAAKDMQAAVDRGIRKAIENMTSAPPATRQPQIGISAPAAPAHRDNVECQRKFDNVMNFGGAPDDVQRPSRPAPEPTGNTPVVLTNVAFWLTGQMALEAAGGHVFLLDVKQADKLIQFAARFAERPYPR
jgi:DNA-binding transcriptional ArsR family regulator